MSRASIRFIRFFPESLVAEPRVNLGSRFQSRFARGLTALEMSGDIPQQGWGGMSVGLALRGVPAPASQTLFRLGLRLVIVTLRPTWNPVRGVLKRKNERLR